MSVFAHVEFSRHQIRIILVHETAPLLHKSQSNLFSLFTSHQVLSLVQNQVPKFRRESRDIGASNTTRGQVVHDFCHPFRLLWGDVGRGRYLHLWVDEEESENLAMTWLGWVL